MISLKYMRFVILLSFCCINTNATQENNNNCVILFSESGFNGKFTVIKPGNYLISNLIDIKSIKIPSGYEIKLSNIDNYDDKNANIVSYPTVEELNDNKDIYDLSNIDVSQYKYLYVLKTDLNNDDGIAGSDEYDINTGKYFGRKISNMTEPNDNDKEKITEITIDYSPEFQGLPDLTKYKNLKNIKILFNVFNGKSETFIKKEYNKIINYMSKVHPLTEIEIQGNIPSYYTVQDNKFFGFNLNTLPAIQDNIQEIHLINCSKLQSIDFSKYKNVSKIYMYGNTFESTNAEQWKTMIEQLYTLSLNIVTTESSWLGLKKTTHTTVAKLTHIQLPRTFTGEIPKISNPSLSQIQYLSALGVTSVAQDAFKDSQSLKELYLPNVKEVKNNAFYNCVNLETVSLDKCEILREGAFKTNRNLKSMHLPLVKNVEKFALAYTRSNTLKIGDLNDVEFKNSNGSRVYLPFCEELGECALRGDNTDQVQFISVNLPVCKKIQKEALRHLKMLKEVNIPEAEVIGQSAFENCGELTKVGDIKYISNNNEILLPKVKSIEDYAFKNEDQSNVKDDKIKGQNNTIVSIILPECESIGTEAFMRYRVLEKLSIPKCKIIKKLAFYDAYKLQKLEAPLLEALEEKVFLYASSEIKSFKTVNGTEEIDSYLELPNVKTVGSQVFAGNNSNHIQTQVMKLPECFKMEDNALQGSRISVLEAPKLGNVSQILSLVNKNV